MDASGCCLRVTWSVVGFCGSFQLNGPRSQSLAIRVDSQTERRRRQLVNVASRSPVEVSGAQEVRGGEGRAPARERLRSNVRLVRLLALSASLCRRLLSAALNLARAKNLSRCEIMKYFVILKNIPRLFMAIFHGN